MQLTPLGRGQADHGVASVGGPQADGGGLARVGRRLDLPGLGRSELHRSQRRGEVG